MPSSGISPSMKLTINKLSGPKLMKLRRLASLAILAHQPVVAAYCKVTDNEREAIIESLVLQKVGSNPKHMKIFKDMQKAT